MEAEQSMRIIVVDLGQQVADVLVDEPQALLGSAAHCDVRLGPDKVSAEQLQFEVRNGVVFAELRATRPQVLLNHAPFHSGRLRDDSVLSIGGVEVRVTVEQSLRASKQKTSEGVKPTFVATIALLGVLLVVAIVKLTRHRGIVEAPAAPALFTARDAPCPEASGEAAMSTGYELLAQAEGKRERAPFVPEDGLAAVPLYRTAGACFEAGGDVEAAGDTRRAADAMKAFVERDYHLHQVRVYRALSSQNTELLGEEAKVLAAYLHDDTSAYTLWLDRIKRDLDVQAAGKRKPKKKKG